MGRFRRRKVIFDQLPRPLPAPQYYIGLIQTDFFFIEVVTSAAAGLLHRVVGVKDRNLIRVDTKAHGFYIRWLLISLCTHME